MILVPEVKQVEPVAAHEFEAFCKDVNFIQIQVKHKDVVMEAVLFRRQAVVHYFSFIEAGIHYAFTLLEGTDYSAGWINRSQ
jgi:hypothetical protein